jgi:hypothetical protein
MNEESQCKILPNGNKEWWLNGKLHHTNGPAIEWTDGHKEWWLNGKPHRTDGPAIERTNGIKEWWFRGKRHRTDGPALECANGTNVWWFYEKMLGYEDEGFWALWELLSEEERSDWKLLQWAPWVKL